MAEQAQTQTPTQMPTKANKNFNAIRFIAYCLFTGPQTSSEVPGGESYLGNEDQELDIAARIQILKNAVDTARAQLPENDEVSGTINVFMAPEFYFHGTRGAYLYATAEQDPLPYLLAQVQQTFSDAAYGNWVFVFGTAVTAHVANVDKLFASESVQARNAIVKTLLEQKEQTYGPTEQLVSSTLSNFLTACHASPDVTVRDRAVVYSQISLDAPKTHLNAHVLTTEKYFLSGEDFILCEPHGRTDVITEQMVGYAHIDLSNGDEKKTAFDNYAIFRQNGLNTLGAFLDYGIEICLDHDDARLRSNLGSNGSGSVHVQLIPSYGSAIIQANVVANANGFVFNCDGQMVLDSTTGVQQFGDPGSEFLYVNYGSGEYGAHSEFAQIQTAATGSNPKVSSASYANVSPTDTAVVAVQSPVLSHGTFADYFVGGPGAVHIYGLQRGYALS